MHQGYGLHHDFIQPQALLPSGAREFTVLLYFNEVESGGETFFPDLGGDLAILYPFTTQLPI